MTHTWTKNVNIDIPINYMNYVINRFKMAIIYVLKIMKENMGLLRKNRKISLKTKWKLWRKNIVINCNKKKKSLETLTRIQTLVKQSIYCHISKQVWHIHQLFWASKCEFLSLESAQKEEYCELSSIYQPLLTVSAEDLWRCEKAQKAAIYHSLLWGRN